MDKIWPDLKSQKIIISLDLMLKAMNINCTLFFKELLIAITALLFLNSCSISEEIHLNSDGSGEYVITFDNLAMIRMTPAHTAHRMKMFEAEYNNKDGPIDTLLIHQMVFAEIEKYEQDFWRVNSNRIDTSFHISKVLTNLPDSTLRTEEFKSINKEYVKDIELFLIVSKEESIVHRGFRFSFNKVEEIQPKVKELAKMYANSDMGIDILGISFGVDTMLEYHSSLVFENNNFERKIRIKNLKKDYEPPRADEEYLSKFMPCQSSIYFPNQIEIVSGEHLTVMKKNTLNFDRLWVDLIRGEENFSWKVRLLE